MITTALQTDLFTDEAQLISIFSHLFLYHLFSWHEWINSAVHKKCILRPEPKMRTLNVLLLYVWWLVQKYLIYNEIKQTKTVKFHIEMSHFHQALAC